MTKGLCVFILASLFLTLALFGCATRPEATPAVSENASLVVFLVRHGEKVDFNDDPGLTAAGHERAAELARTLSYAELEHVHSSDFTRTRDTAAPTAAAHGLDVELYDPRDLHNLVAKLRSTGGRHLVVGHSNTTPPLVELLGGEPGPAIDEANEYDRLYIVTIGRDGSASSVMIRYGKPCFPG